MKTATIYTYTQKVETNFFKLMQRKQAGSNETICYQITDKFTYLLDGFSLWIVPNKLSIISNCLPGNNFGIREVSATRIFEPVYNHLKDREKLDISNYSIINDKGYKYRIYRNDAKKIDIRLDEKKISLFEKLGANKIVLNDAITGAVLLYIDNTCVGLLMPCRY